MTEYKMSFDASLSFNGDLTQVYTSVEEWLDKEPFSPQIRQWFRDHPEVLQALKLIYRNRFIPTHAISVVDNPDLRNVKQAVGIFTIDKDMNCKIKQDYLMHETDDTFVLFTGLNKDMKQSKYVQSIKSLEPRYGPDGANYFKNHHPSIEEVPPKIRDYTQAAINKCLQPES